MSRKITKICDYCKEEFSVPLSGANRRFCSRAHYWEFRKLPIETKSCSKCGEAKPISEFQKSITGRPGKDGYESRCRNCKNKQKRQWYQENRDKALEWARQYGQTEKGREVQRRTYIKNREKRLEWKRRYDNENRQMLIQKSQTAYWSNPEKMRGKVREWSKQNREKIKIRQRRYRDENREAVRARQRRFYENNPDKTHEYNNRRRAIRRGNGGKYTIQQWEALCEFYGNVCLCCGIHANDTPEGKLSPDHVVPLSRGGSNDISNIQPLCYKCNLQKHTASTDYRPRQFQPKYKQLGLDL
jgi:5-methylcytosine-specific restriction endonuclease McrA